MTRIFTITTFVLLFQIHGFGQTTDPIALSRFGTENYVDAQGLKQGLWHHYKIYYTRCSGISDSHSNSDTCIKKISKGYYKDDNKYGIWEYYDDHVCYITINRTENYLPDGSIVEIKYSNKINTTFHCDSSLVTSTILADSDTTNITCENKKDCLATYRGKTLFTFPYDQLDFQQSKFCWRIV